MGGPGVAKASQAAVVEKRRRKKKRGDSEASRILLVQDVVNIVQCANCGVKGISWSRRESKFENLVLLNGIYNTSFKKYGRIWQATVSSIKKFFKVIELFV